MFCNKCGTNLPDEAQYCHQCGTAQNPTQKVQAPEQSWEVCEIVWQFLPYSVSIFSRESKRKYRFWAQAIGPSGRYDAGSVEFDAVIGSLTHSPLEHANEGSTENEIAKTTALDNLIQQLVSDGWQAAETRGSHWFSFRFRR